MENFGRYEVLDTIGKGAMGIVYRCRDPQIGRIVAVKTVLFDPSHHGDQKELKSRILKEAQAAGVLSHPSIVTIFDVGEDNDTVYIVMEYLQGNPLDNKISGNTSLSPREVLTIAEQVGSALDYAHVKGIVHRDVKPANIIQTPDNRAILMDFGIAWMFDPTVVEKGTLIGSPIYMSPEQIDGAEVTGKSDIYSLGTVVYELLTGFRPFTGESFNDIVQAKYENRRIPLSHVNASLPSGLEYFFDKVLAADARQRISCGKELLSELKAAIYSASGSTGFLTSTQNSLIQTNRRQRQDLKGPMHVPAAESDPHMAETLMVDSINDKKFTESMREKKPAIPPSYSQKTAPQPKEISKTESAPLPSVSMPAAPDEEESFKLDLPKLSMSPGFKDNKIIEVKEIIRERKGTIKYQRPEDLTVEGKRALVDELRSAIDSLENNPENSQNLVEVGMLYLRLSKHSEAMAYFKRAIKIDWQNEDAYGAIANIYGEYKMSEKSADYWAIAEWLSEWKIGRLKNDFFYPLGKKLEKLNLIKGALTIWEEGGKFQSWSLDIWKELSRYYLQMKDYRKAMSALQHVVSLSKFDAMAFRNLAVCYQNTKDYQSALEAWESAYDLEPRGEGGKKARKQIMALKKILHRS